MKKTAEKRLPQRKITVEKETLHKEANNEI